MCCNDTFFFFLPFHDFCEKKKIDPTYQIIPFIIVQRGLRRIVLPRILPLAKARGRSRGTGWTRLLPKQVKEKAGWMGSEGNTEEQKNLRKVGR